MTFPPGGYYSPVPDHPKATTAMVLGIVGVVVCGVVAPFAMVMGKRTLAEIDASQGRLGGRGQAQAGYVLGLVGTILLGVAVLFLLFYFVVVVLLLGGSILTS